MQFKVLSIVAALAAAVSAQECNCANAQVTVTSVQYVTVVATSSVVAGGVATPPPFPTGGPAQVPMPTGTGGIIPTPTPPPFTGAGSSLNSNAVVAAVGAGLAAFALI